MKKIISMLLAIIMVAGLMSGVSFTARAAGISTAYSGGSGTQEDPYLLATADDLVALNAAISGDDGSLDAIDTCGLGMYHGYYFELSNDINMDGVAWTPVSFCGNLDGNGYSIKNLSVTEADNGDGEYWAAMFAQLINATVSNITFENCSASISSTTSSTRDVYVAIVAANAIASKLENITVIDSTVKQEGYAKNMGYAAFIAALADISNITACVVDGGSISVTATTTNPMNVGGIAGCFEDMFYEYIADYGNPFNMEIGAGDDYGIYNCYVDADITVDAGAASHTAGIVGMTCTDYLDKLDDFNRRVVEIKNCVFKGAITAVKGTASGISGWDEPEDDIIDCVSLATLSAPNTFHLSELPETVTSSYYLVSGTTDNGGRTELQFASGTVCTERGSHFMVNSACVLCGYAETYTITVTVDPAEGGSVTGGGDYNGNTEVTVTATANDGYKFVKWTENGTDISTNDSYTFTVVADRSLVAMFEETQDDDMIDEITTPVIELEGDNAVMMPEKESQLENVMELYQMQILADDSGFTDISASDWFRSDVMSLVSEGIINGYPDGSFMPRGNVTWGEALKMVLLATRYGEQAPTGDHWASGYMELAIELGIIPGEVDLNAYITRGEMADLVKAAMKLGDADVENPFDDAAPESAVTLYAAGIIKGSADNGQLLFRADSTITRAEISAIIWRVYCAG